MTSSEKTPAINPEEPNNKNGKPIFMESFPDEINSIKNFIQILQTRYGETMTPALQKLIQELKTLSKQNPQAFLDQAAFIQEASAILTQISKLLQTGNFINPTNPKLHSTELPLSTLSSYLQTERVTLSGHPKQGQPLENLLASGSIEKDILECEKLYQSAYQDPHFHIDRSKLTWKSNDLDTLKAALEKGLLNKVVVKAYPNLQKLQAVATANAQNLNQMTRESFLYHTLWQNFKAQGGRVWSGSSDRLADPEVTPQDFLGEYQPKTATTPTRFIPDPHKPCVLIGKDNAEVKEIIKLVYQNKLQNQEPKLVKDYAQTSELIFIDSTPNPPRRGYTIRNRQVANEPEYDQNKTHSFATQMIKQDSLITNEEAMLLLVLLSKPNPSDPQDTANYYLRKTWANTRNITSDGLACYVNSGSVGLYVNRDNPAHTGDVGCSVYRL